MALTVPMVLLCPECEQQHVDRDDRATEIHSTHTCEACGHEWTPRAHPTAGIEVGVLPVAWVQAFGKVHGDAAARAVLLEWGNREGEARSQKPPPSTLGTLWGSRRKV